MKLLRPLAGYNHLWPQHKWLHTPRITADYRHTTQDRWIQTELAFNTCKECHKTESLWNHTATDRKEGEQLEDRRSVGESSCNCGDGTDQRVQSLMFIIIIIIIILCSQTSWNSKFSVQNGRSKCTNWDDIPTCHWTKFDNNLLYQGVWMQKILITTPCCNNLTMILKFPTIHIGVAMI